MLTFDGLGGRSADNARGEGEQGDGEEDDLLELHLGLERWVQSVLKIAPVSIMLLYTFLFLGLFQSSSEFTDSLNLHRSSHPTASLSRALYAGHRNWNDHDYYVCNGLV